MTYFADNDLATQLASEKNLTDEGGGLGGYQTPGTVSPNMLTPDAESTAPVMTASGPTAPAVVPLPAAALPPATVAVTDGFWAKLKTNLGSAQSAVVSPAQSSLRSVAKAVGASDETASKIAPWGGPVLVAVLVTIIGTVYMLRRRIFSHQVNA